ncbi:S41 family peptidase [Fulvivirgaceae bacterium LMO-SS25]
MDHQKLSIVQELKERESLTIDEKIALYLKLKSENYEDYNFENEDELTLYGYSFLWEGDVENALKIFHLIAEEFNSANSYDNLGEAYLMGENTELALINYRKSLKLNPENFNAEDQIELIENPEKALETPADKFAKVYSVDEYKNDLDQLGNKLLEVHPNALKFISKDDFWKTIEEKKSLIKANTTYGEFIWHCSEIIANINCSHTSLNRFFQESQMLPVSMRFPLQVRLVNEQLFVIDPLNNGKNIKLKDEILSINGILINDLVDDIYKHISSQGYITTAKKQFFNTWATAMIPYALQFPASYNVVIKGANEPINLDKAESFKDLFRDPSIRSCGEDLCLEVLNNNTALLTISSFNYYPWNNLSVFTDFIDKSMTEINEKGVQNLIVDVRFNGGGSQQSAIHLLRYLVDKPFKYYSKADFEGKTNKIDGEEIIQPFKDRFLGNQYFIIDGEGNSTTGHFMSLVKAFDLGIIVGEELGSNHFCSAGQTICRLSNTKLQYYVANNTHVSTATSFPDEIGILPDYYVTQDIDAFLEKKDVVKAFTLNLINE